MAGGIRFDQLRASATDSLSGLEAYTDDSLGASSTRVGVGAGLALGTGGVLIDPTGTVSFTSATHTYGASATLSVEGSSFAGTEVPNADWVQTQLAAGISWQYPVLSSLQLDDTNDALSQATVMYLVNNPTSGDTIALTDGSSTESFIAGTDFAIGATPADTMVNLASDITAGTLWSAVVNTDLDSINATVIVIRRKNQALGSYDDRVWMSTVTTGADWQYVDYSAQTVASGYSYNTNSAIPESDPATKTFGPGDAVLTAGQAHVTLDSNSQYVWNADAGAWVQISGTGSITAGAGLTKDGNTINLGDNGTGTFDGLIVGVDAIGVALGTNGGLKLTSHEMFVEPNDFAGTGLEDDGSDNLRIAAAAAGGGLSGGAGSALEVGAGNAIAVATDTISVNIHTATDGVGVTMVDGDEFLMYDANGAAGNGYRMLMSQLSTYVNSKATLPNALEDGNGIVDFAYNGGNPSVVVTVMPDITSTSTATANAIVVGANGVGIGVDNSTIEGSLQGSTGVETIRVKSGGITELQIAAAALLSTGGLQGGDNTKLSVKPDSTTGVTVAPVSVVTNGVGVTVDNSTIQHTTGTLKVGNGSIGKLQLDADAFGAGIAGGDNVLVALDLYATLTDAAGGASVNNNPLYLDATNGLNVMVDDGTIGLDSGNDYRLYVKNGSITELQIAASAIGDGLLGGDNTVLSVDPHAGSASILPVTVAASGVGVTVDDSTLTNDGGVLKVKSGGITKLQLATDVAGDGITGGADTALAIDLYNVKVTTTVGASSATANNPLYVDGTNGVNVAVDGSTIDLEGTTYALYVPDGGITEGQLHTTVAGDGLTGGGGDALAVGITSSAGLEVAANSVGIDLNGTNGSVAFSDNTNWTFDNDTAAYGLFVTGVPDTGNHVVNKTYVDNLIAGLTWKDPAVVITMIGNVQATGLVGNLAASAIEILSVDGDSYVVTTADGSGALTGAAVGDIWQYQTSTWVKVVSGLTSAVPADTYVLLNTVTALISPFTNTTDDGKRALYDGTGNLLVDITLFTSSASDAYVVEGAGSAAGCICEFDGTDWVTLVDGVGGFVPVDIRVVLGMTPSVVLIAPYTEATDDGKIMDFTGASNTGVDTGDAVNTAALLIQDPGHIGINDNDGYTFEGDVPTGSWIQFTGGGAIDAGTGLTKSGNVINAIAGDTSITMNADNFTVNLAATSGLDVTSGLRIDTQGNGLSGGAGSLLSVDKATEVAGSRAAVYVDTDGVGIDLDNTTLTHSSSTLSVKNDGINEDKIISSALGNGLTGGSTTVLSVEPDDVTGATVAPVSVVSDGVGVTVDNSTITHTAGTIGVPSQGITATQIAATVAGAGLTGGNGSALAVGEGNGLTVSADAVAVTAYAGITVDSNGVSVDLEANGSGAGGLRLVGAAAAGEVGVDPSDGVGLDANGVRVNAATKASTAGQYGGIIATLTSAAASGASAGVGYIGVQTDNSTLEVNASNQVAIKADGVAIASLNIRWREEEYAASTFTAGGDGAYHDLAVAALVGTKTDFFHEVYRNGVADMANQGNAGTPTTATQFSIDNDGAASVGRVNIGVDITASGNTYKIRYLSVAS